MNRNLVTIRKQIADVEQALAILKTSLLGELPEQPEPVLEQAEDVLSDLHEIGTIGLGAAKRPLYELGYLGKGWVAEIVSTNPKQLVIRGANALLRSDVSFNGEEIRTNITGPATDWNGLSQPADFPLTVPGYDTLEYPGDKRTFYQFATLTPAPAPNQVPDSTPTTPAPAPATGSGPMNDDYIETN